MQIAFRRAISSPPILVCGLLIAVATGCTSQESDHGYLLGEKNTFQDDADIFASEDNEQREN
jgi:hypothetical protein